MTNRTWRSVYDIPFDVHFRGLPNGDLPWTRFTGSTSILTGLVVRGNDELAAQFPGGFVEVVPLPEDGGQ